VIFVFSYDRQEMLSEVVKSIFREHFLILDDGSAFELDNMVKFPHEGKQGFWKKWAFAFKTAEATNDDLFIFMPDDFKHLKLDRIKQLHEQHKHEPYAYNIINDGRLTNWFPFEPKHINEHTIQVGFVDCGFFCNREVLEKLDFRIDAIPLSRFNQRKNISSGVGQQLTNRFNRHKVNMYIPVKSLAYHGDHESKMHPEERSINPLISK